jgi:hypothetical protein
MPLRFRDLGGLVSPLPPPPKPENLFEPLQTAVSEGQRNDLSRRGQDLSMRAKETDAQQAYLDEQGRQGRAALAAGLQREEMDQRGAMERARLASQEAQNKTKRDDELFKEFGEARWSGDPARAQVLASELTRRGFKVNAPGKAPPPEQEKAPAKPEDKKLSEDLDKMETQILGGLGVQKSPKPVAQLGQVGATAVPGEAPKAVRKGYQVTDARGNVIWEDDEEQIGGWQKKKVREGLLPLLSQARDPAELHAAKLAISTAEERLGSVSLPEAIKEGEQMYRFSIERERWRGKGGKGGTPGGPTKADKFERQMEVQDREYVNKLVNAEVLQQKVKDLRQLQVDADKALTLAQGPSGTMQRQALISALQSAQRGMLSNMDLEFGKNAEGLAANLETAINTLTNGGKLSDAQIKGLTQLARESKGVVDKRIRAIGESAARRVRLDPGLEGSSKRDAYADHAKDIILGASGLEDEEPTPEEKKPVDAQELMKRIQGVR